MPVEIETTAKEQNGHSGQAGAEHPSHRVRFLGLEEGKDEWHRIETERCDDANADPFPTARLSMCPDAVERRASANKDRGHSQRKKRRAVHRSGAGPLTELRQDDAPTKHHAEESRQNCHGAL